MQKTYAIRFDFPTNGPSLYAGDHKGGCGFAPTIRTALLFDDPEQARTLAEEGYGSLADWAKVVPVQA